jgi:hypothetical protein
VDGVLRVSCWHDGRTLSTLCAVGTHANESFPCAVGTRT